MEAMVVGEFTSQSTLHSAIPQFTPKPCASGTYASDPKIHFFLCDFINMDNEKLPDPQKCAQALAKLHENISPTGKYGFSVATFQGKVPQFADWTDTWEEFFSCSFRRVAENEEKAQGHDPEMQALVQAIVKKVIPRLLRPLETEGRSILPRLVHGDIWDGNVATNLDTNDIVIFDSTCIYAHNECKLLQCHLRTTPTLLNNQLNSHH
jgi:protein-ribulosamine 3-kinase